jgi:hypothetical protein
MPLDFSTTHLKLEAKEATGNENLHAKFLIIQIIK